MSQLPNGWEMVSLGDVVTPKKEKSSPSERNIMPFIGLEEVEANTGRLIELKTTSGLKSSVALFEKGDLLYGRLRPYLNKVLLAEIDGAASAEFIVIPPSPAVEPDYLRRTLMAADFVQFTGLRSTGDRPRVSFEAVADYRFPLPPLPEQKRIVAKIDSLSGKSKRARDHLEHIPRLVEKYKQAVLAAAFRGDLTREWRAQNPMPEGSQLAAELLYAHQQLFGKKAKIEVDSSTAADLCKLPKSWTWMPVAALSTKVVDGVHKKPTYQEQGIPFLTVRNLTAGPGISFEGCRFVSTDDHLDFIRRTNPEHGDILITKDGTLGVVRAVRTRQDFSIFVSLALVKPIDRSMTDYLELAFLSPILQQQMGGVGSGLQHIHLTDLRRDLVPVAPPEERDEIVRRARKALDWIERLASEAASARQLIQNLDQAVLAKAFRGELVPQDPSDEPAAELLERIAARRAAAPEAKRARSRKA